MSKELVRLRELDKYYDLQFADMAENLEDKWKRRQIENYRLIHEIDGIPRKRYPVKKIEKLNSGGLYMQFGNNILQQKINKAYHCMIKKC